MNEVTEPVSTGQRPYSIRTRIKTRLSAAHSAPRHGQRPYSIRTRIKTEHVIVPVCVVQVVRDHIPLEQGLRHKLML